MRSKDREPLHHPLAEKRMRILNMLLSIVAVAPIAAVQADDCTNASTQTTMNSCADQTYRKTDAELNTVYKQITARLKADKETTQLLIAAQKSWLGFRDTECAFSTSATAQGSIHPMLVAQCRAGLTSKRITELKTYLHCQEGDMSCPVPSS
jgi:uncharacterized protein YecT (DUF1311 family)